MAETSISRKILFGGYAFLFLLGITFYVCWSWVYNTWTDVGVYAVSATLIGFGFVGMLLYSRDRKE